MRYWLDVALIFLGLAQPVLIFILHKLIPEWIKNSIEHDYAKKLADYKADIDNLQKKSQEVWLIKRDACMKALKFANAVLSNYTYPGVKKEADIFPQYLSIEEGRACIDELACSCDDGEVLEVLKKILFGAVSPDIIVDLRNAIRKELGFSSVEIDKDHERSFLGRINCVPQKHQADNRTASMQTSKKTQDEVDSALLAN